MARRLTRVCRDVGLSCGRESKPALHRHPDTSIVPPVHSDRLRGRGSRRIGFARWPRACTLTCKHCIPGAGPWPAPHARPVDVVQP
eukprot:4750742-Prymnesium_polylepis.1